MIYFFEAVLEKTKKKSKQTLPGGISSILPSDLLRSFYAPLVLFVPLRLSPTVCRCSTAYY